MSTAKPYIRFYLLMTRDRRRFPNQFPMLQVMRFIESLSDEEAYVELENMEILGDTYAPSATRNQQEIPLIILNKIIRHSKFGLERNREVTPLRLPRGGNLAEQSSFGLFPKNVLAVMRNGRESPSSTTFREYINALSLPTRLEIEVIPLVDSERLRALNDAEKITKFTFAVGNQVNSDVFRESSKVRAIMDVTRRNLGSVDIEFTIKISPSSGRNISDPMKDEITNMVRNTDALESLSKAQMTYRSLESGKSEKYNFLDEILATQVEVDLGVDTGLPESKAVSTAMMGAYNGLRTEIDRAMESLAE